MIFGNSSLAERAAGISFGVYGLIEWPFGFGGGAYSNVAPRLDEKYGVMEYFFTAESNSTNGFCFWNIYP